MKKGIFAAAILLCLLLCSCAPGTTGLGESVTATSSPLQAEADDSDSQAELPAASETAERLDHTAFFNQVKDYILSGKESWSPSFLDAVDLDACYESYLKDGGEAENISAFAAYLTNHAPVSDNWKSLFENDLMDADSVTPDHYEDLGDGSFQVFVKVDGKTVPYVTVNSRTGWYHG